MNKLQKIWIDFRKRFFQKKVNKALKNQDVKKLNNVMTKEKKYLKRMGKKHKP